MGALKKVGGLSRISALAVALVLGVCSLSFADGWTPIELTSPVQIINVTTAIGIVMTFVGGIVASLMVAYLAFAAVGMLWRWLGSFARRGKT